MLIVLLLTGAATLRSQECELQVSGFDDVESPHIALKNVSSYAVNKKTKVKYQSVPKDGFRFFGEIPEGRYSIYLSKPSYKTTVQRVNFSCSDNNLPVIFRIKMWKGSSRQFVTSSKIIEPIKVKEMRLDRITKLGDSDTGARVIQPGESYTSTPCKSPFPRTVSGGVLNGKALSLPKPDYPPAARAVKASGAVSVQVLISESGSVISATPVSGHPLLRAAAESAARGSSFSPTLLCGQPVKVSGVITYNFVP